MSTWARCSECGIRHSLSADLDKKVRIGDMQKFLAAIADDLEENGRFTMNPKAVAYGIRELLKGQ